MEALSKILVGQPRVQQLIQGFLAKERIAGAYLVYGPEGTPVNQVGQALAETILCREAAGINPCGFCDVCEALEKGKCLDIQVSKPEGNTHKIESLRKLQEMAATYPWQASHKVFNILEADQMRGETADALLKTLEEPPATAIFILSTSNVNAILPTIFSRCQPIRLGLVTKEIIKEYLIDAFNLEPLRADVLARVAGGKIDLARSLIETDFFEERDKALDFISNLAAGNLEEIYPDAYPSSSKRDIVLSQLLKRISIFRSLWRDLFIISQEGDQNLIVHVDLLDKLLPMAKKYPSEMWNKFSEASFSCEEDLLANVNVTEALDSLYFAARVMMKK